MATRRYIIVSPVRDEAPHIDKTIEAVRSQTLLPARWIVVDDGSTDGTGEILDKRASQASWMRVVHRPNRGRRVNGSGVMEAFYAGYALLDHDGWDYLVKLDGDLSFAPDYFERCLAMFAADPRLGIGGGTVCQLEQGNEKVDSKSDPTFHVRGATKIYRRECWDQIAPLVPAPGWDTVDEVKANMLGWATRTFPELRLIQHKETGAADGAWRNAFKNGRANYVTGYDPMFMLAKCVKRGLTKPLFVEGLAMALGFCSGYVARSPRVPDPGVIDYLRRQQRRRLLLRASIYG
ncbi:MAG: glycosyltransferase [Luteitalea sp.]|nr:glycosyltransferase [Luteitalea sp.]